MSHTDARYRFEEISPYSTTMHYAFLYCEGSLHFTQYIHNRNYSWYRFHSESGELLYDPNI